MFLYLRDRVFLTGVALYAANRWLVKPNLPPGELFFRGHFNDFLVIPCALPPLLYLHRKLSLRHTDAPPRAHEIALHLLVWSLFFELLAPRVVPSSRADAWDVAAYCAGGLVCWLLWNARALLPHKVAAPRNLTEPFIPRLRRQSIPRCSEPSVSSSAQP